MSRTLEPSTLSRVSARRRWFRTSVVLVVVMLFGSAFWFLLPTIFSMEGSADGRTVSRSNLSAIALAIHAYADEHGGKLPPAVVTDKTGRPLYSWRVLLLPYLDQKLLFKQFHLDEPWDSEHNKTLLAPTPWPYRCPLINDGMESGLTFYQAFVGPGTAFERPGVTLHDFPDGLSETFLVVEAAEKIPWSKPQDIPHDPQRPLPKPGAWFSRASYYGGIIVGRQKGFHACLADCSVRFFPETIDEASMQALITRNGGENLDMKSLGR